MSPLHTTVPFSMTTWRSAMLTSASMFLSTTRIAWPSRLSAPRQPQISRADERRQALGRLVEDQQLRIGHQRAADRQHLLLAAGELRCPCCGARSASRGNSA